MSRDRFVLSASQAHEIGLAMNRPESGQWTPGLVHLLTQGGTLGKVRKLILNAGVTIPETIVLPVDYSQTLEVMIALGNYDWKYEHITKKNFPLKRKGVVNFEFRTFHFNCTISSEEAQKRIREEDKTNPWTDAGIEHLLAYGAALPEEQRKYPIVALGSVAEVYGRRDVPCLGRGSVGRSLGLGGSDSDWSSVCRFLAVREISVT